MRRLRDELQTALAKLHSSFLIVREPRYQFSDHSDDEEENTPRRVLQVVAIDGTARKVN
jgi:hypothetical protein